MNGSWEEKVLNHFLEQIESIKEGLDPEVLAHWYNVIELEAKSFSPEELRNTIEFKQDPILWMKFSLKASRRTVPYIIQAIEKNLSLMSFATKLYFQKVEELIQDEAFRFDLR